MVVVVVVGGFLVVVGFLVVTGLFVVGGFFVVGGIIGALLLKKINNKALRIIFAIVMVIAGIKMIV